MNTSAKLLIPIAAVTMKQGNATVEVWRNQRVDVVPITTGATTLTQVEVISGITAGEQIVVPN